MIWTPKFHFPKPILWSEWTLPTLRCTKMEKKNKKMRKKNIQMANRGQGPFSFWRMIGVFRPRNWIDFVLYVTSSVVSLSTSCCIASWLLCVSSLGESEGGGEDEAVAIDDPTKEINFRIRTRKKKKKSNYRSKKQRRQIYWNFRRNFSFFWSQIERASERARGILVYIQVILEVDHNQTDTYQTKFRYDQNGTIG